MFAPKIILVPTDFSPFADAALKRAVDMAEQHQAKLFLLHVVDEKVQQCAADYCLSADVMASLEADILKQAGEKLKKEAEAIAAEQKVDIVFDLQKGNPADVILKEQKDKEADLIVIASHGRTGLSRYLIGGVTDKVVRGASCSVVVVKP